ncbi:MAG: hypothetical protein M1817_005966 [Caeruleum heppii]|nr:MAG: hypothetical protein M1817_005966 [Caeruleum heppii]
MSPMIDLDAALGPFNTPETKAEFGAPTRGGFHSAKRRMHSSGTLGGFSGPGMHYHRRTESAPEMAAFESGHFGIHRLGSSSTMADVFEEDEEAEEERTPESDPAKHAASCPIIPTIKRLNDDLSSASPQSWDLDAQRGVKRKGSGLSEDERHHLACASQVATLEEMHREVQHPEPHEASRPSFVTRSSDSTVSPSPSESIIKENHRPGDLEVPASLHASTIPDTPSLTNSSFPSPEFPATFDIPHALTAASSFTDDHTLNCLIRGEPGPELRVSVDDVPSLTSSCSTTTNAAHRFAGPYASTVDCSIYGERPASVSSAMSARPRSRMATNAKRASFASLSRLVGSSHCEKSKLSIEEKAQPESPEKAARDKKGNRLSRLMHFWRPKEAHQT